MKSSIRLTCDDRSKQRGENIEDFTITPNLWAFRKDYYIHEAGSRQEWGRQTSDRVEWDEGARVGEFESSAKPSGGGFSGRKNDEGEREQ